MAVFNMRLNPNTPFSGALGFNPKGVVVQNYTPYWLYFPQADQYCPPWTDGWTTPLIQNSNGYGYMLIQTPQGRTVQTNVTTGVAQFVNLQWTDNDVDYSEGTPGDMGVNVDPVGDPGSGSVVQITSFVSVTTHISFSVGPVLNQILPIIPNKKYRIYTVAMFLNPFGGNPPVNYDSGIFVIVSSQTALGVILNIANARLTRMDHNSHDIYANGLDCPVGGNLQWIGTADFASQDVQIAITYQVIG